VDVSIMNYYVPAATADMHVPILNIGFYSFFPLALPLP
jgi:hypothetical protein